MLTAAPVRTTTTAGCRVCSKDPAHGSLNAIILFEFMAGNNGNHACVLLVHMYSCPRKKKYQKRFNGFTQ